jgi:hypothetical protein
LRPGGPQTHLHGWEYALPIGQAIGRRPPTSPILILHAMHPRHPPALPCGLRIHPWPAPSCGPPATTIQVPSVHLDSDSHLPTALLLRLPLSCSPPGLIYSQHRSAHESVHTAPALWCGQIDWRNRAEPWNRPKGKRRLNFNKDLRLFREPRGVSLTIEHSQGRIGAGPLPCTCTPVNLKWVMDLSLWCWGSKGFLKQSQKSLHENLKIGRVDWIKVQSFCS